MTRSDKIALHHREGDVMKSPRLSLSFFLRALVTIFCAAMAIYQVSSSITTYLDKPTTTTMEKGSLQFASPSIWVCRKPGINLTRLQELGYASLEDLSVGRWMGQGSLDWSANGSLDAKALYDEITEFEGNSLLQGGIVANTEEKEGFIYWAKKVTPSFNIDFGECVELNGRPVVVNGRSILRENQPVSVLLDFKNVEGTFNIIVTDKMRIKYKPNMRTSTTPLITVTNYAKYNYNFNMHITKTIMQEEDEKADCKVYGEGREFKDLHDCYLQEQEEFFMRKLGCLPPQFAANTSLMCQGKLDPALFDKEVRDYFYDIAIDSGPTNCSTPCTTLDISTTLTAQTPRHNGSMVKLIMDKEVTVVRVDFSMNIFKLTAEVGGYLGLWLGFSMLDMYNSIELMFARIARLQKSMIL